MNEQDIFSALSNPTRRAILAWMRDVPEVFGQIGDAEAGEVCISSIQKKTNLSQSTVSAYMASLERAGLVISKRSGQWTFFKRDENAISTFAQMIREKL